MTLVSPPDDPEDDRRPWMRRGRSAHATRTDGYDKAFIASLMPSDTPTSFGSPLIAIAASFSL